MQAEWLLLTHFSQRYPKATPLFGAATEGSALPPAAVAAPAREPPRPARALLEACWNERTGLAYDHLTVAGNDVPRLVALREGYSVVFAGNDDAADNDG